MTLLTPELLKKLVAAERAARCVVGWVSPESGAEPIRIHHFRYVTPTGNERECSRCGEFRHYGPRLRDRVPTSPLGDTP